MPCLENTQDELTAGKLAGEIVSADNKFHRQLAYQKVPPRLRKRVIEIKNHYLNLKIERIAQGIAGFTQLEQRRNALLSVDDDLLEAVKDRIKQIFYERKRHGNATDQQNLGRSFRRVGKVGTSKS